MKYTAKNKPTSKYTYTTKYNSNYTTTTKSYDFKEDPVNIPDEEYDDEYDN